MASPMISRVALRRTTRLRASPTSQWVRHASSNGQPSSRGRMFGLVAAATAVAAAAWAYPMLSSKVEAEKPEKIEIVFEKPREKPVSKEDNRDLVSSQHLQVKKSWENPGVHAWGSNSGKVAAPDSNETVIKMPRRIKYFDGQLLRDLKLDREFGAAITENGDLVQWGIAFSKTNPTPTVTLKGKDLAKLSVSRDRIIALTSGGSVYSIPVASDDQAIKSEKDSSNSSWVPFLSGESSVSYRSLKPENLAWNEKITDISSGLEHCLMLTSKGRVFAAASSTSDFPSKGQLGIPGLTWQTKPDGPYDQPHEVGTLKGFNIEKIATGDFHSLALDSEGRVFAFGDNSSGQLGMAPDPEFPCIDSPSLLPFAKLYSGTNLLPKVTNIAAGGLNSYFTVDATKIQGKDTTEVMPARDMGRTVADTWACGEGIYGALGTGKWTHVSSAPAKIKALSNLSEYDEATNSVVPIRLASLSVGSTHAAAVMDNVTRVDASNSSSEHDTNYGADIVWWGGNEHYQLGTGKRSNANAPLYIGPLDGGKADARMGRKGEFNRFQITPRKTVRLGENGKGRQVSIEQRVECGRYVTSVYSAT
ncbi:regulator of chromosome condensation 1/beta-lactamase-inhibitor protein II [Diplogelasinospora grovesii]|uniref:Regulator of chromosome condensation 1/beta-lactamase-inhibitor protein II n=1 Tax=Diplogelasinospora grovesii TaxID=303347 RepID=A0AAN6N8W0_9PEZI|nr:regulator of chromosome condensation 1/beta-lactamase-inhibitor protein II [Diplogelasinospora grovesii]